MVNMFIGILVKFLTNLVMAMCSEKLLAWVFFTVANKFAALTKTTMDDEWLAQLQQTYNERTDIK